MLPSPVVRVASLTGRIAVTALQTWQATARPNPVAPARAAASHSPVAAAAPPHVTAPYLPVDPSAKITAAPRPPRYRPAPDIAPLPEPALAVFEPNPVLEQPQPQGTQGIRIDGTVFTAVLAPRDGRKNWPNILTAFTTAFADTPSATLVLKMIGEDASFWWWELHRIVKALPPFACRVVVLSGYLAEPEYQALIACTHFVVNASLAEGQCLPLVEFMSGHCPAIAPRHTAMLDYVGPENAIIVESSVEFCAWPHDPRNHLTTTRHRVEWQSLCDAFALAWRIFHQDPARYAAMSKAAAASVRGYCADAVVGPRLASFLGLGDEAVLRAGWRPLPRAAAEPLLEPAPAPLRPDRAGTTA